MVKVSSVGRPITMLGKFTDSNSGYGDVKTIEAFELCKSIANGEQPTTSFAEGYRVDRVCSAVAESAISRQWVKVD